MVPAEFLDYLFDILNENDIVEFADIRTIKNGYEVDYGADCRFQITVKDVSDQREVIIPESLKKYYYGKA